MTQSKREPFAKATKHPTLDTWLVADAAGNNLCWADDSQAWEQWDAESRANSINAAFNARVDEEVRKALEAFREKAKKALVDYYGIEKYGPIDIISNLPTEPEGK